MTQIVTPYLHYADVAGALDFLSAAFGFRETLRMPADDGSVNHAEMDVPGGGHLMLGDPGPDYRTPHQLGGLTQVQFVVIDQDVAEHCERARAAGAVIVQEPHVQSYGPVGYLAEDPEGHQWSFNGANR
ncbi:VOC family protein [Actinosynnema sp. NPDC020468]|uniref:VOC family protein n=1 Tax=Actinosynnema sp. NPDC020468 TaxID=3154488 RepID=UPI0033D3BBBF